MEECIARCTTCHQHCMSMLTDAGVENRRDWLLLLDCAEICQTSANFMLRDSLFHPRTCGVCADVCARCADLCDGLPGERAASCAEACRRCAESCTAMSEGQGHDEHHHTAA